MGGSWEFEPDFDAGQFVSDTWTGQDVGDDWIPWEPDELPDLPLHTGGGSGDHPGGTLQEVIDANTGIIPDIPSGTPTPDETLDSLSMGVPSLEEGLAPTYGPYSQQMWDSEIREATSGILDSLGDPPYDPDPPTDPPTDPPPPEPWYGSAPIFGAREIDSREDDLLENLMKQGGIDELLYSTGGNLDYYLDGEYGRNQKEYTIGQGGFIPGQVGSLRHLPIDVALTRYRPPGQNITDNDGYGNY